MMIDIRQTEDGDLDLTPGDITLTDATGQHQRDILLTAQGGFKQSPEVGVDSAAYINDSDPSAYLRSVRLQMAKDGMRVRDVALDTNGNLTIDAEYEDRNS